MISPKWDLRFLHLAQHIASWSRDPSTQTGAVIVDPDKRIVSVGFNGFPRGVADDERLHDRETKYRMVVHAEVNGLLFARGPVKDCTVYVWPWPPCGPCTAALVQSGVARVVAPPPTPQQRERWGRDFETSERMFFEASVKLDLIPWTELSWSETPS